MPIFPRKKTNENDEQHEDGVAMMPRNGRVKKCEAVILRHRKERSDLAQHLAEVHASNEQLRAALGGLELEAYRATGHDPAESIARNFVTARLTSKPRSGRSPSYSRIR